MIFYLKQYFNNLIKQKSPLMNGLFIFYANITSVMVLPKFAFLFPLLSASFLIIITSICF